MPGEIAGTESIIRFLANEISRDTYVNLMNQYQPAGRVSATEFREINRRISTAEYDHALESARHAGLWRIEAERSLWYPCVGSLPAQSIHFTWPAWKHAQICWRRRKSGLVCCVRIASAQRRPKRAGEINHQHVKCNMAFVCNGCLFNNAIACSVGTATSSTLRRSASR